MPQHGGGLKEKERQIGTERQRMVLFLRPALSDMTASWRSGTPIVRAPGQTQLEI
jgi:hypothetical protein